MKQKLKICIGCGFAKRIFSNGRCIDCSRPFFKPIVRTKLTPHKKTVSSKSFSSPKSEYISVLKSKLDAVFSLYIRHRGSVDGYNQCITCEHPFLISELQDGHYFSRVKTSIRWDETNNHPQCNQCNVILDGNLVIYKQKMIVKYGQLHIDYLASIKNKELKLLRSDYLERIEFYSKKLKEM